MITTLLKHEWLRTRGMLGAIIGIAALAVGVGTVLTMLGWPLISGFGTALGALVIVALVLITQFALAFDFWNSSFRRTGYFTHSLPFRGGTIYAAKALWGLIVTLALLVLTVLLAAVFWLGFGPVLGTGRNLFALIGQLFEVMPAAFMIGVIAFLVLSYLGGLLQLYFAATLGSGKRLNRLGIGGPVIFYILLYMATQALLFVGMIATPLGINMASGDYEVVGFNVIGEMLAGAEASGDVMPLGFVAPMLLISLVALIWSAYSWNRKVALA